MSFLNFFKKQNWGIKIGFISLVVSLVALVLALTLIMTANFVPKDPNSANPNLVGHGFTLISNYGVSYFLTSSGYSDLVRQFSITPGFISAPLIQLVIGVVLLVIILPVASSVAVLSLAGGYFKRWLYT